METTGFIRISKGVYGTLRAFRVWGLRIRILGLRIKVLDVGIRV